MDPSKKVSAPRKKGSTSRKKVSPGTQAEVLVQSRRRCCVCYGLNHDDKVKKGQIAHLDGNKNNSDPDNLAYLCFDHHDEYDSKTSQSKNLTRSEVVQYRNELIAAFGFWSTQFKHKELLNFLASQIDLDAMARAAVKIGQSVVFYGPAMAFEVLTTDAVDWCDADLYVPHLICLDHFASWGWLTYTERTEEKEDEMARVYITTKREPICDQVAARILALYKGDDGTRKRIEGIAERNNWKAPSIVRCQT